MPHAALAPLTLSAVLLGAALATAWWQIRARRRYAEGWERGHTQGVLDASHGCMRRLDAKYRAGYDAAQRDTAVVRARPGLVLVSRN